MYILLRSQLTFEPLCTCVIRCLQNCCTHIHQVIKKQICTYTRLLSFTYQTRQSHCCQNVRPEETADTSQTPVRACDRYGNTCCAPYGFSIPRRPQVLPSFSDSYARLNSEAFMSFCSSGVIACSSHTMQIRVIKAFEWGRVQELKLISSNRKRMSKDKRLLSLV